MSLLPPSFAEPRSMNPPGFPLLEMGYPFGYYPCSSQNGTGTLGGVPEWPKGADCKSAGAAFRGSNPLPPTEDIELASIAQLVEHFHGKEGVTGSSPVGGSIGAASLSWSEQRNHNPRVRGSSPCAATTCILGCGPWRLHLGFVYGPVSYTHLRAHETDSYLVCRLLLEKKKKKNHHHT